MKKATVDKDSLASPPDEDEYLSPPEVKEYCGPAVQTLAVWRMKEIGPPYHRVGRLIRYRRRDLDLWLESRSVEA